MRVALDTNLLAYAEGVNTDARRDAALEVISRLPEDAPAVPVQVLGELFSILVRKGGRSRTDAHAAVLAWSDSFPLIETSSAILLAAVDLAARHQLFIWDAVVLSAASDAGCRLLLSEDMQDGFTWGGVTVTSPFAPSLHPVLAGLLRGPE